MTEPADYFTPLDKEHNLERAPEDWIREQQEFEMNEEAADVILRLYPCWCCEEEHPRSRLLYDSGRLYCEACYDRGAE